MIGNIKIPEIHDIFERAATYSPRITFRSTLPLGMIIRIRALILEIWQKVSSASPKRLILGERS